jgi:hypothetical protein
MLQRSKAKEKPKPIIECTVEMVRWISDELYGITTISRRKGVGPY